MTSLGNTKLETYFSRTQHKTNYNINIQYGSSGKKNNGR
jgi:hypothetical protein